MDSMKIMIAITTTFVLWANAQSRIEAYHFSTYINQPFLSNEDLELNILEIHKKIIETNGGYYSNIVRPDTRRLTGLHCVKTIPYYEKTKLARETIPCTSGSDEILLFQIVEKSINNPLENTNKLRPIHGFHFSLMRGPTQVEDSDKPIWNVNSLEYQKTYLELKTTKEWQTIYPFFDDKYKDILKRAEENF